jgi:hypothetical protein
MSPNAFAARLALEPGRSRILLVYVLGLHGLALLVLVLPLALPLVPRLTLMVLLLWQLGRALQRLRRPALKELIWQGDGHWQLFFRDGTERVITSPPQGFVWPWLVALKFRDDEGAVHRVLLLADMLPADQFRRLRVRLAQARRAAVVSSSGS